MNQDLRQELNDLYFEAGAGLYASQALEYSLKYFIYLLSQEKRLPLGMQDAEQILDGRSKKTLGKLFGVLADEGVLDSATEAALIAGIEARNDLIHRYFITNVERMVSPPERETMVREVRALRRKVQRADKSVSDIVDRMLPFHLLTFEQFIELLDRVIKHGKELDNDDA